MRILAPARRAEVVDFDAVAVVVGDVRRIPRKKGGGGFIVAGAEAEGDGVGERRW